MYQLARFAGLAVAIGVVVGCGGSDKAPDYAGVSGTVTYNGQPLPKGQITFSTDGRPPSMMEIVDGKFAGQAMVGSNKVSVAAFRKTNKERKIPAGAQAQYRAYQAMNKGGGGGSAEQFDPTMEDYIPDEWGRESKQIRVVEPGVPNTFQIDIKGK
jgi:hypothetical protein